MELGLLGAWTGIDAAERAMLAQGLCTAAGGDAVGLDLDRVCAAEPLRRASDWGKAIRLAARLTGGATALLARTRIELGGGMLTLTLRPRDRALAGGAVRKQLQALAEALNATPAVESDGA